MTFACVSAQADEQSMGVSERERGTAALKDLAQLQRAPKERTIFRRNVAKGPNPLSTQKKKRKAGAEGQKQKAAVQGEGREQPKRKRVRVRRKDGGSLAGGADGTS